MEIHLEPSIPSFKLHPTKIPDEQSDPAGTERESSEPIPLVEVYSFNDVTRHPTPDNQASKLSAGHRWKTNIQFGALCISLFCVGWNDGTVGPLLPRIQDAYHVRVSCC